MVSIIEEIQLAVRALLGLNKFLGPVLVIHNGILLPVEDNGGRSEAVPVLLHPLNRHEERLGHLDTQEGNHEPILEDVVHELVVLGERSGVDHGVYDEILQFVSDLLDDEQLHEGDIPIFGHAEQRACENAAADVQLRAVQKQLHRHQSSHAMRVQIQWQLRPGLGKQGDDVIL